MTQCHSFLSFLKKIFYFKHQKHFVLSIVINNVMIVSGEQ